MTLNSFKLILLAGGLAVPSLAQAQTNDLIGVRASSAENMLEDRGYTAISSHADGPGVFAYWWNNRSDNCLAVQTIDGRIASAYSTSQRDCGRHDGKGNAAAGVAIGALLVGVAAAAHKSHHHDNDRHFDDWRREEAFERGYREGHSYSRHHNWNSYRQTYRGSQIQHYRDYNSGYSAGQRDSWRNLQIRDSSEATDEN